MMLRSTSDCVPKGCGASYTTPRHLDTHEEERCRNRKRELLDLLDLTESLWEARKRRKLDRGLDSHLAQHGLSPRVGSENLRATSSSRPSDTQQSTTLEPAAVALDDNAPLALRKPMHMKHIPGRYREDLSDDSVYEEDLRPQPLKPLEDSQTPVLEAGQDRIPTTAQLTGGLVAQQAWRFYGIQLPSSDPEQRLRPNDFDDPQEPASGAKPGRTPSSSLAPFPNLSSFLFADWCWNGQNEKSADGLAKFLSLGRQNTAFGSRRLGVNPHQYNMRYCG
ncbi:hypothetical protein BKA70DRAFT_1426099 [Coprinopsis sp. MPI-PUGE-AT-0042]|nr:hypothetical protein BKA70DRAFT_1426099 [Coprinopsis sp. MPI-PUGE-AT-0042]